MLLIISSSFWKYPVSFFHGYTGSVNYPTKSSSRFPKLLGGFGVPLEYTWTRFGEWRQIKINRKYQLLTNRNLI
ncbi:hypothetical protein [Mucilaginibacter paludis]|uniref:hypothetical protein n=1 Tax=Mucilaginibacter paludis TaxID=423351 RepID=UPI00145E5AFE|nr:hypothetical protein [Mucilaginibacter paludis]